MEQSNFYSSWLTQQPAQSSPSSSFDDWSKERPTTANHASPSSSAALTEMNDIFTELGAPASPSSTAPTSSFYNSQNYYVQAPYNSIPYGATWSGPSNTSTTVPLSSYSSLNGATSSMVQPTQLPSQSPTQSTQMVIDPILVSMNGTSTQPTSQPQRPYSQTPTPTPQQQQQSPQSRSYSFSDMSIYHPSHNVALPQYISQLHQQPLRLQQPQAQQPQQLVQGTLSPQSLHSPSSFNAIPPSSFYASSTQSQYTVQPIQPIASTSTASSTPTASSSQPTPPPPAPGPSPAEKRAQLYTSIKPLLVSANFTGAGAVQSLAQRIDEYGITEVDAQLRMEVLTKIRDGAGNHYFRAWGENAIALELTREWLKQAYSAKQDNPLSETTMPILHIIDRLPLTVESLKASKLGKLVVKLVKEPPTPAIKDMASNVERRWRQLVDGASTKANVEDLKSKKRKLEAPNKAAPPLAKKLAFGSATSTKPITVKKESSATAGAASSSASLTKAAPTKDAKSDSSFFSAPKAKPKLPSFRKALPPAPSMGPVGSGKKDGDGDVAQPSSIDPFQEVLKSMKKARKGSPAIGSALSASATPPPGTTPPSTSGTPTLAGNSGNRLGKKKKSVTWAPDGSLEVIKLIERAVYDDEPVNGIHLNLRDLHRGEGAALHAHLFEETVDWSEPLPIEIPIDIEYPPRGEQSDEKTVQEQREQTALSALYMTEAQIPDTPAEASNTLSEEEVDKDVIVMTSGPDVDSVFWSSETIAAPPTNSVADILSQLSSGQLNFASLLGGAGSSGVNGVGGGPMLPISGGAGPGHDVMMELNNVDPMSVQSLPPEQLQMLLQQLNPTGTSSTNNNSYGGSDQPWPNPTPANHFTQFGYSVEDTAELPRWSEGQGGRGRGRGRGKGRGGRGDDGYRHSKRKPCSFFQSGRCKYGDQCDFAHEIIS